MRDPADSVIYSLRHEYLLEIFDEFPKFKEVMTIRALRRHHYFRRLKNQQKRLLEIRNKACEMCANGDTEQSVGNYMKKELLAFKRVRLFEDKLSYEQLVV